MSYSQRTLVVWAVVPLTFILGCGQPGGPTPNALVIEPRVDVLLTDTTIALTANARFASGAIVGVQPRWSTSDAAILSIDAGLARGIANGMAVITATHEGVSDRLPIRVAPNYNGQWSGTYRVTSCSQDASFPLSTICSIAIAAPANSMVLSLVQDKLAASGVLTLSFGSGPASGTVDPDGALIVAAGVRISPYTVLVERWRSTSRRVPSGGGSSSERMSGTFELTWQADNVEGMARMIAATDDLCMANC